MPFNDDIRFMLGSRRADVRTTRLECPSTLIVFSIGEKLSAGIANVGTNKNVPNFINQSRFLGSLFFWSVRACNIIIGVANVKFDFLRKYILFKK